jgi:hypothetical protein
MCEIQGIITAAVEVATCNDKNSGYLWLHRGLKVSYLKG